MPFFSLARARYGHPDRLTRLRWRLSRILGRSIRWPDELELAELGAARWDLRWGLLNTTPPWRSLCGAPEHFESPQDWLERLAHPLDRARLRPALDRLLNGQPGRAGVEDWHESLRLQAPGTQEWRWFSLKLRLWRQGASGRPRHLLALLSDISWRRVAQERERMSITLFEHVGQGLAVLDMEQNLLDANPAYCSLMRADREALLGAVAQPLQPGVLRRAGHDPVQIREGLAQWQSWQGRVSLQREDGELISLALSLAGIPEPEGPPRYQVLTLQDQTLQIQQQRLLEAQQSRDALTGLPNLAEFRRRLAQALDASRREGFALCVVWLDLDRFRQINDQHGRMLGDRLLLQVGRRLDGALRSGREWADELAHLGGDEFGLLLRCKDAAEAELALQRLLNVLRAPFPLAELPEPLDITASLGATLHPRDQSDAETLLRHAAHALYRVKRSGRNAYQLFDTEKHARSDAQALALGRMQEALDAGELCLHYQPKVDMRKGLVLGVEALLRWQHPEKGLLGPAHFLPVLERTGLGVRVGDWVIEQALKQSSLWLSQGLALRVSVNVAARHLQADDFTQRLQELLARHPGVPLARHLMLEVLESAALADIEATQVLIRRCRALGVSFALDDFGTGYSTLTYLKRLPVDALKIDRSFIQNMLIDAQDHALVKGVISLAKTFDCSVVAEGVESAAHARALMALGCELGQGNGIAPAMPAAELVDWVARFQAHPVLAGRQDAESGLAIH
ncbi:MAG: putative bifunctional diguanylate cyclase/phosphodiesterase [Roseateles sp.]